MHTGSRQFGIFAVVCLVVMVEFFGGCRSALVGLRVGTRQAPAGTSQALEMH